MVSPDIHDLFLASASVAGALIGLLFVAISVAAERLTQTAASAQVHRIRAAAALTAFTNALAVSLFALVPGHKIGPTSVTVAALGLAFIGGALLSIFRLRHMHWTTARDALFLIGLAVTFVIQLDQGAELIVTPRNPSAVSTIGILVIVCFLVGISRAWELVGGPSFGIAHEVTALVRGHGTEPPDEDQTA